jgi:hypothetical protein
MTIDRTPRRDLPGCKKHLLGTDKLCMSTIKK